MRAARAPSGCSPLLLLRSRAHDGRVTTGGVLGPAPAGPERVRPATSNRAALLAAALAFFIIVLDITVVSVALPSIGRELHGGLAGLEWIIDGYVVVFSALLLSSGTLSD